MNFLEVAYRLKCINKESLKKFVITEENKFGKITKEEYKKITGITFK